MRLSTTSGPLAALFKILTTFLLFHLLTGHSAALPTSDLAARQPHSLDPGHQLDVRSLQKRSNCQPGDNPDLYNCDGDVSGVDEVLEKIREWGVVGSVPSVFYTGHPIGLAAARKWAGCFFTGEPDAPTKDNYIYAIWQRLTDPKWLFSQSFWIREEQPDDVSDEDNDFYADLLLKHLAQAFAEAASGDVYLVVGDDKAPDDRSWDANAAWGGMSLSSFCHTLPLPLVLTLICNHRLGMARPDKKHQRQADLPRRSQPGR